MTEQTGDFHSGKTDVGNVRKPRREKGCILVSRSTYTRIRSVSGAGVNHLKKVAVISGICQMRDPRSLIPVSRKTILPVKPVNNVIRDRLYRERGGIVNGYHFRFLATPNPSRISVSKNPLSRVM